MNQYNKSNTILHIHPRRAQSVFKLKLWVWQGYYYSFECVTHIYDGVC